MIDAVSLMKKSTTTDNHILESDHRLGMQLLQIELALQGVVALVLAATLWSHLPVHQLVTFVGMLAVLAMYRVVVHAGQRPAEYEPDTAAAGSEMLGRLANGALWGAAIVILTQMGKAAPLPVDISLVALVVILAAAFIGSALRPWPFLIFTLPAIGLPLAWSLLLFDAELMITWALMLMMVVAVAVVINKHRIQLSRIRSVTRQNASLMQNLATARDHALRNQHKEREANRALQQQMEERKRTQEKIHASERELSEILEDLQDTYFRVDRDGKVLRVSPSVRFLVGMSPDAVIGKPMAEMLPSSADFNHLNYDLERNVGHLRDYELCMRHQDGREVWASVNCHYFYEESEIGGFEGTIRDVTEKRQAEELQFQQKERLRVTLESIGDGVITTDLEGMVDYLNPRAELMTGWLTHHAQGNPLPVVMRLVDEDDGEPVQLPVAEWVERGEQVSLAEPAMLVHRDEQRQSAIELTGAPIRDSLGATVGSVLVFRDVTKLRSLVKQLAYQATHDALTGLPNRVEFEKRVEQALRTAQSGKKEHAVCFIDLDQFKVVNDTCGHQAGDLLLQQLARLMTDMLRVSDTLARLGGDEFGVLLPGCPMEMAQEIAEKLRAAVEEYRLVWEGDAYRVGLSIGLVPVTTITTGLTELLQSADAACYVAKERGRNCVHVFQPDDAGVAEHLDKMQWMQRIQHALDEDMFELHYQPVAAMSGPDAGRKLHGEILLRMIDSEAEGEARLITPMAFLPTAERFHLMPQIDRWVVSHALAAINSNERAGIPLGVCAINLSGQSLSDLELLDFILNQIRQHNVSGHKICFEITESAVIANLDNARQFINRLKELGCSFALDDFGSGLSSFDYLKNLPVDFVKLDGALIRDVATSKVSQAMVHAINYVAHVMGMESIAEYVENDEILEQLYRISIDYAQGYAIGKPAPFQPENLRLLRPDG